MASSVTKWRRLTRNRSVEAGSADPVPGPDGGGNLHEWKVRKECDMFINDVSHLPVDTEPFDFPVNSDLTIVLNATKETFPGDGGNADVDMVGSIDGVSYTIMAHLIPSWNMGGANGSGGHAENIGYAVYDVDTYGTMPYMAIRIDASANPAMADFPMKIVVTPV